MVIRHSGKGATRWRRCVRALWLIALSAGMLMPNSRAWADGGAPNLAYVVVPGASGGLAVVDIAKHAVVGHIAVGGDPQSVVLGADSRLVFVSQATSDRLAIVDANAKRVTATVPAGRGPGALAVSAVTAYVLVVDTAGDTVTIIDAVARRVVNTVAVGKHPVGVGMAEPGSGITTTVGDEAYVANMDDNTVSVINVVERKVVAVIPAPGGPLSVTVPAIGGVAYVATRDGNVLALGLADHRLLGSILQRPGGQLGTMDYDAVTGEIYVPDAAANAVYVLRPAAVGRVGTPAALPSEPARVLSFAGGPVAVAITFDGAYGFVAERDAGRIAMIDPASRQVVATVGVGGSPRALVTAPYPAAPEVPPAGGGLPAWVIVILAILALAVLSAGGLLARRRFATIGATLPSERPRAPRTARPPLADPANRAASVPTAKPAARPRRRGSKGRRRRGPRH